MKDIYKITVELTRKAEPGEGGITITKTIYSQEVDNLDLKAVINAINK